MTIECHYVKTTQWDWESSVKGKSVTRGGRCGAVAFRIDNSSLEWSGEGTTCQPAKSKQGDNGKGRREKGGECTPTWYIVISAVKRYRTLERKHPRDLAS